MNIEPFNYDAFSQEIHFNHLRLMIELSFINKILHDTTDLFFQYKYMYLLMYDGTNLLRDNSSSVGITMIRSKTNSR